MCCALRYSRQPSSTSAQSDPGGRRRPRPRVSRRRPRRPVSRVPAAAQGHPGVAWHGARLRAGGLKRSIGLSVLSVEELTEVLGVATDSPVSQVRFSPVRVLARPVRRLRLAVHRLGGLHPARHRRASRRPDCRQGGGAVRARLGAGAPLLEPSARRGRDPGVPIATGSGTTLGCRVSDEDLS